MPLINLSFPTPINVSVQPGDIAYYINATETTGGFTTHNATDEMIEIGPITQITENNVNTVVQCDMPDEVIAPTASSFVFFGKDRSVNESSLVGYYGRFKFKNSSKDKAELFSTACEIAESSK